MNKLETKITMNDFLRKLPIGIQTFEKLITGGYIYIDKTALIHLLASFKAPCLLRMQERTIDIYLRLPLRTERDE